MKDYIVQYVDPYGTETKSMLVKASNEREAEASARLWWGSTVGIKVLGVREVEKTTTGH